MRLQNMLDFSNQNFAQFYTDYKSRGINMDFILKTFNSELNGVDPYDENLTDDQKRAINQECQHNIWYFLRKVVKFIIDEENKPSSINIIVATIIYIVERLHYSLYINHQKSTFASTTLDILELYHIIFGETNVRRYNPKGISENIKLPEWLLNENIDRLNKYDVNDKHYSSNCLFLIDNAECGEEEDILKIYQKHIKYSYTNLVFASPIHEDAKKKNCFDLIASAQPWSIYGFNYYEDKLNSEDIAIDTAREFMKNNNIFYVRYPDWELSTGILQPNNAIGYSKLIYTLSEIREIKI